MRRELLLLREMRDAAVTIRDLIGNRTAEEIDADPVAAFSAVVALHCARGGCQPDPCRNERRPP